MVVPGRGGVMGSVLVTGGAGFIGSNIVDALLEQGDTVAVLDDLSAGHRENVSHHASNKAFTFYQGSILDAGLVRDIITRHKVERISHQAAAASVTKSIQNPVATSEVNIIGTINIFDLARELGCKRVVFASSCAVYGDTTRLPITESQPISAKSPYSAAKASDEILADAFRSLYGIEILALRYFNVFGRRQDPKSDYAAVIPKFITHALKNEPIPVDGDGMQTRDFIYIEDVVKANLRALAVGNVTETVFNVACGRQTSVLDLAKKIISLSGSRSVISHNQTRVGDIRASHADVEKARRHLDFSAAHDIDAGLSKTIAWYRQCRAAQ
jgi:UDP-glucose 4-epimerase